VLLLSVSSAFHWSEGRCWPLYRNSRRAHYTEANFAIPAISAPVPQQTAQALAVFARRCVHFFSLTACLFCQRPRTQLTPQTPPPLSLLTQDARTEEDDEEATGTGQRQRPRPATSARPRLCVVRLRAQALRLRLQPLVRRRMPRLVPPRPSVAPSTAHTTVCSKPPAIASLVAL
jgi:hypothetical protein